MASDRSVNSACCESRAPSVRYSVWHKIVFVSVCCWQKGLTQSKPVSIDCYNITYSCLLYNQTRCRVLVRSICSSAGVWWCVCTCLWSPFVHICFLLQVLVLKLIFSDTICVPIKSCLWNLDDSSWLRTLLWHRIGDPKTPPTHSRLISALPFAD